jgi:hypothetical protein
MLPYLGIWGVAFFGDALYGITKNHKNLAEAIILEKGET